MGDKQTKVPLPNAGELQERDRFFACLFDRYSIEEDEDAEMAELTGDRGDNDERGDTENEDVDVFPSDLAEKLVQQARNANEEMDRTGVQFIIPIRSELLNWIEIGRHTNIETIAETSVTIDLASGTKAVKRRTTIVIDEVVKSKASEQELKDKQEPQPSTSAPFTSSQPTSVGSSTNRTRQPASLTITIDSDSDEDDLVTSCYDIIRKNKK